MIRLDDGTPTPLGASFDGRGVNFAVFSEHGIAVDLCLFDPDGRNERRLRLPRQTEGVWHGYFEGVGPGQLYGYRVHGPYEPRHGHRFNPNKLLIDPYARQLSGTIVWDQAVHGYLPDGPEHALDPRDSAVYMPKGIVEDLAVGEVVSRPVRHRLRDSVIYEAHVKGLTQLHPDIPAPVRGRYDALAHPKVIEHLLKIGVTAVELLPIHAFVDDHFLVKKGLRNYWGYSTLNYFAPEPRYMSTHGAAGLREAIATLHSAGIEVILDVVYNHTCEGNEFGPTLSFKGFDNAVYYKLPPEDLRRYWDATGTGNTLNVAHPQVLRMVLDSLRHWVEAYGVDGFRFDLATTLARQPYEFDARSGFLAAVGQDPVLRSTKLIAEPWDLGMDGYQVGGFPRGWAEWNDQYRDTMRSFWRGNEGQIPRLARSITGSREIYHPSRRHPWSSVNFITSHDGFTLNDVVTYEEKHNYRNGEQNRDGHHHNLSCHYGIEGPTDDPRINDIRARQKRNLLATLMLSIGTPMITAGDEMSRTQLGNNNAYCQDNDISWVRWTGHDAGMLAFTERLANIRATYGAFRRHDFLDGRMLEEHALRDIYWLAPEGREISESDWGMAERRAIGLQIGNEHPHEPRFLIIMNAGAHDIDFKLPLDFPAAAWHPMLDSGTVDGQPFDAAIFLPGTVRRVPGRSFLLFRDGD